MRLRRKFRTFYGRMSAQDRRLVYEAALLLALARLIVLTLPLRIIAPWLCRAPETRSCDEQLLRSVRRAVTIAARNVPWNAVCLPQALYHRAMTTATFADFLDLLIADQRDSAFGPRVEDIAVRYTGTLMKSEADKTALAQSILGFLEERSVEAAAS